MLLTRFAPAPTGLLHLGHVANAVAVWGMARAGGGRVLLRIEDHDRQRATHAFERALLDDLDWLGFAADVHPTSAYRAGPCAARQSERDAIYKAAVQPLVDAGLVYGCTCSRREIRAAGDTRGVAGAQPRQRLTGPLAAPDAGREDLRYPGTCRHRGIPPGENVGWRLRIEPGVTRFVDEWQGPQAQEPAAQCGDLLLRDRLGNWTYQLAVVVDDLLQEIDLVVRGLDLLESTGRQIQLARLLGRPTPPRFAHHALVMKSAERKLSKSDGDTGIAALRQAGWSAPEVIGLAAARAGFQPAPRPIAADAVERLFVEGGAEVVVEGERS